VEFFGIFHSDKPYEFAVDTKLTEPEQRAQREEYVVNEGLVPDMVFAINK
jgi:hypothetical protein